MGMLQKQHPIERIQCLWSNLRGFPKPFRLIFKGANMTYPLTRHNETTVILHGKE